MEELKDRVIDFHLGIHPPKVKVTSFIVDLFNSEVSVIYEVGVSVNNFKLSLFEAKRRKLIDLTKLTEIIERYN